MKKFILLLTLGSFFSITGCAGLDSVLSSQTSGAIGCPSDLITIKDAHVGMFSTTWTAKCNGKTYYCSGDVTTSCKESQITSRKK